MWSQLWLIKHPDLKAQVYVVRNKSKLVGVLFRKEPKVPMLIVWTIQLFRPKSASIIPHP